MKNLFFLLFLFFFSCGADSLPAEKTAIEETLIYISSRGEGFNLYTRDLATNTEKTFTDDPGWEWGPQFLPSLNLVLFNSQDTNDFFRLRVIDKTGLPVPMEIPQLPDLQYSPNGKWLSFTRNKGNVNHILIAPVQSLQDSIQITQDSSYHGRVKWANKANQLAYLSDKSGSNEIYLYQIASKATQQLTNNKVREKYFSWSPDDTQLATTMRGDSTENDIYVIEIDSGKTTQLTMSPENESEIAWSPSGKYLAYHAKVDESDDIFLLQLDNLVVRKVTNGEGYHGEPAWIWE